MHEFYRQFQFDNVRSAGGDDDQLVEISFSSEMPVLRFFGYEILSHEPEAVDLSRLNNGGPLLIDHDTSKQIGVVEKAWIENNKGKALVRFSKSQTGQEIYKDVLDGIRRNVSVGYWVEEMEQEENNEDGVEVFKVVRWTPFETSLVPIPHDVSVGVGRSKNYYMGELKMKQPKIDDSKHAQEIMAMKRAFNLSDEFVEEHLEKGCSADEFRKAVLEKISTAKPIQSHDFQYMQRSENRQFKLTNLVRAVVENDWSNAGYEREVHQELTRTAGKKPQGFYVPSDLFFRASDLTVGNASQAGNLSQTSFLGGQLVEALRNRPIVVEAGALVLNGLVGTVEIPRQTGAATASWVAEDGAAAGSGLSIGKINLSPKNVTANTTISRQLLLQSGVNVEQLVLGDLQKVISIAVDLAAINGSGESNQPTGILNTSGIGSVAIGENGGAITYEDVLDLESEVAIDNAERGTLAYVTNPKVRKALKQLFTNSTYGETPVWQPGINGDGIVNGYTGYATNQIPSNLTKGSGTNLSAMIFGNWNDLIVGLWSAVDLIIDPYTGAAEGQIKIVAHQSVDVSVRHAQSFAACVDIDDDA